MDFHKLQGDALENFHNIQSKLPQHLPDEQDMDKFRGRLTRTKTIVSQHSVEEEGPEDGGEGGHTKLKRCLTTLDLISLGVGSCCGTGMYVVAGLVAKNVAGPAAIFSFVIAALASILSGVCYGEFGVRVPKTSGSAYMYSYVTVGEFVAFLIGWNLILEYMIGSAAGASALSACFDALGNHSMSASLEANVGTVIGKTYPDFLGFFIGLAMTAVLAFGVQGSLMFNNILNLINFVVWALLVLVGFFYIDGSNWTQGGGFAPEGASGVFTGAATCFYAFIGFDIIATTGEEAKNPSKSIPIAIVVSLVTCLVAYMSVTMILTMMVPYQDIHGDSALVDMFGQAGAPGMKWLIAIGAVAALTVSLLGSMFPMPRVIYAMSRDGLLFETLSHIHPKTGTPLVATVVCGVLASFMSLLVGLKILVEMMSIGTLLAYTLVSISVMILRYQPTAMDVPIPMAHRLDTITEDEGGAHPGPVDGGAPAYKLKDAESLITPTDEGAPKSYGSVPFQNENVETGLAFFVRHFKIWWMRMGFPSDDALPNAATAKSAIIFVGLLTGMESLTCLVIVFAAGPLSNGSAWAVLLLLLLLIGDGVCFCLLLRQPQNKKKIAFMAPAVPFLPASAVFFNIYLMLKLPGLTWARLGIWLCIGLLLYFSYSMFHSRKEQKKSVQEALQNDRQTGKGTDTGQPNMPPISETGTEPNHIAATNESAWQPQTNAGQPPITAHDARQGFEDDAWSRGQNQTNSGSAWPQDQGRAPGYAAEPQPPPPPVPQQQPRQRFPDQPPAREPAYERTSGYEDRGGYGAQDRAEYGRQPSYEGNRGPQSSFDETRGYDGGRQSSYDSGRGGDYSQDGRRAGPVGGSHEPRPLERRSSRDQERLPPSGSENQPPARSGPDRGSERRTSDPMGRYRGTNWQNPFHEGGGY